MQLEGTLEHFPLTELITMIVSSSVTGTLEIGERTACGQMFCRDGRFYHAQAHTSFGVEAVERLLELTDAPFRFTAGVVCEQATISLPPDEFVANVEHCAGQWAAVRQHVPSLNWLPVPCVSVGHLPERASQTTRLIFAAANGQRSAAAIAEQLRLTALEVSVVLCELVEAGLLRIEPPATIISAPQRRAELRERIGMSTPRRNTMGLLRRLGL